MANPRTPLSQRIKVAIKRQLYHQWITAQHEKAIEDLRSAEVKLQAAESEFQSVLRSTFNPDIYND